MGSKLVQFKTYLHAQPVDPFAAINHLMVTKGILRITNITFQMAKLSINMSETQNQSKRNMSSLKNIYLFY